MKLLQQLWDLEDKNPSAKFQKLGLALIRPLSTWTYHSTPINSTTFATTGGDGDHFGLIHLDGTVSDKSPVVMTLPMWDIGDNIIVGENLHEFLCLGCKYGYASLEILPEYLNNGAFDFFHPDWQDGTGILEYHSDDQEWQACLALLVAEFDLKPWTNEESRLNELQQQYLPLLQLKDW